ncbi:MAG TPA: SRPBCC domain-containing protein, partial [Thermoanaerobaculia bacterium]|nr:SRPBCC domain-containing protein [Thermoanaerobaculia bacterium]
MTTASPPARPADTDSDHALVIERTFDAPRDLVWSVFTRPEHLVRWWGPRGFVTRVEELDLRPGGRSRYVMVAPDGKEYPAEGVFREVVAPERIVSTGDFGDDFDPGDLDLPQGMVVTYLFEELDGGARTHLTLRTTHATAEDKRKHEEMGFVAGWNSSFECLDDHLTAIEATRDASREIVVSRHFDAPRERVWDVWTDLEHV